MKKVILGFLLGAMSVFFLYDKVVFYRLNCNTKKYGWMWENASMFNEQGFHCYNSPVAVERETSLDALEDLIGLELGAIRRRITK